MAATLNYEPIEINAYFRSHTHLPLWEILEKAGFWNQVAIKVNFTYRDSSSEAEAGLFSGQIDLISGNHISPVRIGGAAASRSSHWRRQPAASAIALFHASR